MICSINSSAWASSVAGPADGSQYSLLELVIALLVVDHVSSRMRE
jgi:hypothetical protein